MSINLHRKSIIIRVLFGEKYPIWAKDNNSLHTFLISEISRVKLKLINYKLFSLKSKIKFKQKY